MTTPDPPPCPWASKIANVGREIRSIVSIRWFSAATTAGSGVIDASATITVLIVYGQLQNANCKIQIEEKTLRRNSLKFAI
jgi:hypothetical protein